MKNKIYVLFFTLFVAFVSAQEIDCSDKESQLSNALKDKNYDVANALWSQIASVCPKHNQNIYSLGIEVLSYNLETAAPETKEARVRELLKTYKNYDIYFSDNKNGNLVKSAMALYNSKVGSDLEIYNFLDQAYLTQKGSFINSQAIYVYFYLYYKMFKEQNATITTDQVINKYYQVNALALDAAVANPSASDEYERAKMAAKALMFSSLKCDDLLPYFTGNYDQNSNDVAWLQSALATLSSRCKTAKIFEKIAVQFHKLAPSAQSNFYLGEYYLNARQQEVATTYFDQSVLLAKQGVDKAKKAYAVASIVVNSDKEKAKKMILLAAENEPTNGQYYMFLANLYSNSVNDCSGKDIDQTNAIYKLASITVLKSAKAQPNLLKAATKLSADYLKKITNPNKGKTVEIACWINETVQL